MVILKTRNKITDFFMILAWASPFNIVKMFDANRILYILGLTVGEEGMVI